MAYENRGRFERERHDQNKGERERGRSRGRSQAPFDLGSEEEYWREPDNLPDWGSRESGNREWGRERSASFSDPRRTHGQTGVCESCGSPLYGAGQRRGPYSGKGPKGYRRSDERIAEDVNQALMDHPDIDASEIEVSAKNGEVTLRGSVSDRWAKRQAEECIEQVPGVQDVRNELRARQPPSGTGAGQGGTEHGSRGSSSSRRMRGEER